MNTKHGIVVLLDALGARGLTPSAAAQYLETLNDLRNDLEDNKSAIQQGLKSAIAVASLADLRPRFFGDTILLTCELRKDDAFPHLFDSIMLLVAMLVGRAVQRGVLFRGAVAIGEYIEDLNVAIGPAVTDAATWHDKINQVGVICTPRTTLFLKAAIARGSPATVPGDPVGGSVFLETVPTHNGDCETYVLDWVAVVVRLLSIETDKAPIEWYYHYFSQLEIPAGTEEKYANTERYFLKRLEHEQKAKPK